MRGSAKGEPTNLCLNLIHPELLKKAVACLDDGNVESFLFCAKNGNQFHLDIVWQNIEELRRRSPLAEEETTGGKK